MTLSHWATATLTALLGSQPLPGLSAWTPAAFYSACQLYLKTLILGGPGLFVIDAPFGRFSLSNSAFKLPGRLAFSLMELPAPVIFVLALASPNQLSNEAMDSGATFFGTLLQPSMAHFQTLPVANLILASLYVGHYIHRAVLQPLMGPARSPSHISVFLSAFVCQTANGFTMGSWLGGRSPALLIPAGLLSMTEALSKSARPLKSAGWFAGILPRSKAATPIASSVLPLAKAGLLPPGPSTVSHPLFLIGVAGWAIFFLANVYHDEILLNLRRPAKRGDGPAQGTRANAHKDESKPEVGAQPRYEVPTGGLYSFISYPNYLCECKSSAREDGGAACSPLACPPQG